MWVADSTISREMHPDEIRALIKRKPKPESWNMSHGGGGGDAPSHLIIARERNLGRYHSDLRPDPILQKVVGKNECSVREQKAMLQSFRRNVFVEQENPRPHVKDIRRLEGTREPPYPTGDYLPHESPAYLYSLYESTLRRNRLLNEVWEDFGSEPEPEERSIRNLVRKDLTQWADLDKDMLNTHRSNTRDDSFSCQLSVSFVSFVQHPINRWKRKLT